MKIITLLFFALWSLALFGLMGDFFEKRGISFQTGLTVFIILTVLMIACFLWETFSRKKEEEA